LTELQRPLSAVTLYSPKNFSKYQN